MVVVVAAVIIVLLVITVVFFCCDPQVVYSRDSSLTPAMLNTSPPVNLPQFPYSPTPPSSLSLNKHFKNNCFNF